MEMGWGIDCRSILRIRWVCCWKLLKNVNYRVLTQFNPHSLSCPGFGKQTGRGGMYTATCGLGRGKIAPPGPRSKPVTIFTASMVYIVNPPPPIADSFQSVKHPGNYKIPKYWNFQSFIDVTITDPLWIVSEFCNLEFCLSFSHLCPSEFHLVSSHHCRLQQNNIQPWSSHWCCTHYRTISSLLQTIIHGGIPSSSQNQNFA